MLTNGDLPKGADRPEVLIVGAGAVGLILGIVLARQGRRVTIVEGGPPGPPDDFRSLNAGPVSGQRHLGIHNGRMKALGGTTRLWGGQLVPFGPSDFRETYAGKPAWPIDHAVMSPWFDRAFEMLGVPAAAREPLSVWRRTGGSPPDVGPSFHATMNVWLPVADFTKLFAVDIAGLSNLHIVTNTEAEVLEFDVSGRLSAVIVQGPSERRHRVVASHTVLANGTMEITRTLLRAASTAPNCPFRGNSFIGKGFIDHLHGIVGRLEARDVTTLRAMFENIYLDGRKYSIKIRASDQFLERHRIANCAATFNATASIRQALADVGDLTRRVFARGDWRRLGATVAEAARTLRLLAPTIWSYIVRRRSHSLFDRGILLGLEIEQIPTSASWLFLDPDEPSSQAAIGVNWGFDGRELEAAAVFCQQLAHDFAEKGWGVVELDPRIIARDTSLFTDFHDAFHHMGGARMAATAAQGVVDRDLRVFGCDNLSVLGAAVFPSGSFANPTLTAMALAHRLADRLMTDIGPPSPC